LARATKAKEPKTHPGNAQTGKFRAANAQTIETKSNTMKRPDILKGPFILNGANVTAKGDWQLLVASPPYKEAPNPTPDALATTTEEAMQLAVAINALPDLLEALEDMLETALACSDKSWSDAIAQSGTNRPCDKAKSALIKAGYTF